MALNVMRVLVVNAGSSSVKLRLLDGVRLVEETNLETPSGGEIADPELIRDAIAGWSRPDVITHRVVHGGTRFRSAVRIDDSVRHALGELATLAPLHQPKSLAALDAVTAVFPNIMAVACFDTAFHATMPQQAVRYAIPPDWEQRYGARRYGFHGLSHAYCSRRAVELVTDSQPTAEPHSVVTCHLGSGASLAAVVDGRSVDTTMGFTPLEGVVMATRSGSVDPGLVLWLAENAGLTAREVGDELERHSGLVALCGTSDMREVLARMDSGDDACRSAFDLYCYRIATSIGAMSIAAGGLDILAFTGGVGENSPRVRAAVSSWVSSLGVRVDEAVNDAASSDRGLSAPGASVATVLVQAREDLQMVREVVELMAHS
jgi:acetate kinase